MKWDTIKDRCVSEASKDLSANGSSSKWGILLTQLIKEGNGMTFYSAQKTARGKCYEIIDSWDIRQWESLRDIFPNAFPKGLKKPELTDKGWELV